MKSEKRSWADLPSDLLSLILSRLIVVDSTAFRAVCKSWRSIISAARHFFPATDFPFSKSSCLMSLDGSLCKFYHPLHNAMCSLDIPELFSTRIRSSNLGWLLMDNGLNNDSKLFFFNPFTKDRIFLPYINLKLVSKFHFSSPPTSPDCSVIGLAPWNQPAGLFIIKRGELQWRLLVVDNSGMRFLSTRSCSPVFSNGKYYFLAQTDNIGVFVFDVEKEIIEIHDGVYNKICIKTSMSLLVEANEGSPESLLMVFTRFDSFENVNVVRFNLSRMAWEDVESLGSDKMLYLSDAGAYLETSVARGMGNKIYFPKFHNRNGVFYSLTTRMYRSFDGTYSSGVPIKLLKPPHCAWIKPSYTKATVEELNWCEQLAKN